MVIRGRCTPQGQQILEDVGPYMDSNKVQTVNAWKFYYAYGKAPV